MQDNRQDIFRDKRFFYPGRLMKTKRWGFLLGLFFAILVGQSTATPPDIYSEWLQPIASSSTGIVWLLKEETNLGTHHCQHIRWSYLTLDLKIGQWKRDIITELRTCDQGDCKEPIQNQYIPGKGRTLGRIFSEEGIQTCPPPSLNPLRCPAYKFMYTTENGFLYLHLQNSKRKLETQIRVKPYYDPKFCANCDNPNYHNPRTYGTTKVTPEAPKWEFAIEGNIILTFYYEEEINDYYMVTMVPRSNLFREKSYLCNELGFEKHKKGDFKSSASHFQAALKYNPKNHTALYNLACAHARLGQPNDSLAALEQLALLKDIEWIRQKVAQDSDFDVIRNTPRFIKLLGQTSRKQE